MFAFYKASDPTAVALCNPLMELYWLVIVIGIQNVESIIQLFSTDCSARFHCVPPLFVFKLTVWIVFRLIKFLKLGIFICCHQYLDYNNYHKNKFLNQRLQETSGPGLMRESRPSSVLDPIIITRQQDENKNKTYSGIFLSFHILRYRPHA